MATRYVLVVQCEMFFRDLYIYKHNERASSRSDALGSGYKRPDNVLLTLHCLVRYQ